MFWRDFLLKCILIHLIFDSSAFLAMTILGMSSTHTVVNPKIESF